MRGTVVNTPGYYYAISYWISALVMILVHGCGKKDVWKYVYGVLSFISIFTVMFFTDGIKQMFFMPLMVCVFLLMLLYIRMAGELPWRETGFFCAKAFINAEFAASLCWQIHYFYTGDFSGQEKGTPEQMLFKKAYKTPRLTGFLQKTGYLAPNRRGRNSFLQNAETR